MEKTTDTIARIREIEKQLYAYDYALSLIDIDDATVAPSESGEGRSEAVSILSMERYHLLTGTELGELVDAAQAEDAGSGDAQAAAELRQLKRLRERYINIPAREFEEDSKTFSKSMNAWRRAKAASDFSVFAPWLERVIEICQRHAGYMAPEKAPYDVWLDHYEWGMNVQKADPFFASLRDTIVPLLHEIEQRGKPVRTDFLHQSWPIAQQRELSAYVMQVMGLGADHCVLSESEHPFTAQLNDEDVRITTHYYEDSMISSMYSVIHEGGHALYERHVAPRLRYTVLAGGSVMSIHESQSRLFENFVGRSREFLAFLWPELVRLFPQQLAGVQCEELYRAVNQAKPGLIRMDADELTYPLHIMVRYELEKQLIGGTLAVKELPDAWNAMYKEYLGVDVPDDAHGVLQDMHWSSDFGYFPSYALGTAYAAQMVDKMREQFDFAGCCANGDLGPIKAYLAEHIWQHGQELEPAKLVVSGCGGQFDPAHFTHYLEKKYTDLYEL